MAATANDLKPNLTHYLATFIAFDPNYDPKNKSTEEESKKKFPNPRDRGRHYHEATVDFLNQSILYSPEFSNLATIRETLKQLNALSGHLTNVEFAQNTQGKLAFFANTSGEESKAQLQRTAQYSLAVKLLRDPNQKEELLKMFKQFFKTVEHKIAQSKQPKLDERAKLNDIDRLLLTTEQRTPGLHERFFGGAISWSSDVSRSNLSLFANGDFNNRLSQDVNDEELKLLINISNRLKVFLEKTNDLTQKLGVVVPTPVTIAPSMTR